MKEKIRKRLEEKGHTNPDKAMENFGVEVEQKGHPRFSNEGFMWYGSMITDPTKDETGRFTVDPRVYYAGHYEQWLTWKARRTEAQNVTQEAKIEQKQEETFYFDSNFKQGITLINKAWRDWLNGPMTKGLDTERAREGLLRYVSEAIDEAY